MQTIEDPGKILHPKIVAALVEYLRRHRPILVKSLGPRAAHNVTFKDEEHGEGEQVHHGLSGLLACHPGPHLCSTYIQQSAELLGAGRPESTKQGLHKAVADPARC